MSTKRVLVTGSSRGIGRAIAMKLAENGWDVAVHFNANHKEALDVSNALGALASGVYACDLSDPHSASTLIENVLNDGPFDALVNNAGVYRHMDFLETRENQLSQIYDEMFSINFASPLFLTHAACKHFKKQGHGKILNVASRVGFRGEPGAALYAASKAALINLVRSLAVELADNNIQVFGIAPGWVETAMVRPDVEARLPEILSGLPLGRMASPEDCAAVVAFLLGDSATYLSGTTIDINGASYFH